MEVTIGGATPDDIQNIALTTALTALTFTKGINSFMLQTRSNTAFRLYKTNDAAGNYWLVKAGQIFSADLQVEPGDTTLYVRTDTGSDTLEVFGLL